MAVPLGFIADQVAEQHRPLRLPTLHLSDEDAQRIATLADPYASAFAAAAPAVQRWIGGQLAEEIGLWVPPLSQFLEPMHAGQAATRIVGLPDGDRVAPLLTVALSTLLGEPFNYRQQNDGVLAQRIQSREGAPANSNATPEPFGWHCDDSGLAPEYRTRWITLFASRNPTAVTTGIAQADDLIAAAAQAGLPIEEAFRPQFSKRLPKSFNLGEDVWVDGLPLMAFDDQGRPVVAWPTYATRPSDPADRRLTEFLAALESHIDHVARHVALAPGHFLAFSNDHVLHCRSAVGNADRLLFRSYVRPDLSALSAATGEPGPIFDLGRIIAAQFDSASQ